MEVCPQRGYHILFCKCLLDDPHHEWLDRSRHYSLSDCVMQSGMLVVLVLMQCGQRRQNGRQRRSRTIFSTGVCVVIPLLRQRRVGVLL
jgi:hypothetical protein